MTGFFDIDPYTPLVGFKGRKAAQIASFFANLEPGVEKLKLIKLIYLSERKFMSRHGIPMIYDELYSLKDGPVCSSSLNGINGNLDKPTWSEFVALEHSRNVFPLKDAARQNLDELSDAELDALKAIWEEFGHMSASQIRNWTHDNCKEYTEVKSGRVPIRYLDIFQAIGFEDAAERAEGVARSRKLSGIFS